MELVQYIHDQTAWLYEKIYQNELFFFDLWSVVHLWSGLVIMLLLRSFRARRPFLWLSVVLIAYELAEILILYLALNIFRPETIKDQFTDIFVGLLGGVLTAVFLGLAKKRLDRHPYPFQTMIMALAVVTYTFPWVGFYHYSYNLEVYNTGTAMNFITWSAWTIGGMMILQVYYLLGRLRMSYRLLLIWVLYFPSLLIYEFITYHLMGIHESSAAGAGPLIFGLIHGTLTLHVFYVICPLIMIGLYLLADWLVRRGINRWSP